MSGPLDVPCSQSFFSTHHPQFGAAAQSPQLANAHAVGAGVPESGLGAAASGFGASASGCAGSASRFGEVASGFVGVASGFDGAASGFEGVASSPAIASGADASRKPASGALQIAVDVPQDEHEPIMGPRAFPDSQRSELAHQPQPLFVTQSLQARLARHGSPIPFPRPASGIMPVH
jgi:hypothetical protein